MTGEESNDAFPDTAIAAHVGLGASAGRWPDAMGADGVVAAGELSRAERTNHRLWITPGIFFRNLFR
jgi:hypothetical protein